MPIRTFVLLLIQASLIISVSILSIPSFSQEETSKNPLRKAGNSRRFRIMESKKPFPFGPKVKEALENREWKKAWAIIDKKPVPKHADAAYLFGYIAQKTNHYTKATTAFSNSQLLAHPLLGNLARIHGAQAAFDAGSFEHSAGLLAGLKSENPFWKKGGSFLFSQALIANGKTKLGLRALDAGIEIGSSSPKSAEHLRDIGTLLLKEKEFKYTLKAWRNAMVDFPGSPQAEEIQKRFEKNRSLFSKEEQSAFTARSKEEKLKIGEILFEKHHNKKAILVLSSLKEEKDFCKPSYLIGKSYTKLRKHKEAIPWYKKALQNCQKKEEYYLKSLYQLGRSHWNSSNPEAALKTFSRLVREFEKHSYADDAMLYRGRILLEQKKKKEAHLEFRKQLKAYPKGDMAADAQWYLFRDAFVSGKYKGAIKIAEGFEKVGGEYSAGRLPYFVARAKQLLSKKGKGVKEAYSKVVSEYPLSYYALLAEQRLAEIDKIRSKDLCKNDSRQACKILESTHFSSFKISEKLKKNINFRRAMLLQSLALYNEAGSAFKQLRGITPPHDLWGLAKMLHNSELHYLSHDIARRRRGNWESTYPSRNADERWELSYPQPYSKYVSDFTKKNNTDPNVLYAIMREESGFNPQVRSWAGALGLLQLMPGTAKSTATKSGISQNHARQLFLPQNAIEIGSAYMGELGRKSGYHPAFIIAGYNGGWGNLSRWLGATKTDQLDLFVEEIPYGQTRNYTKRVLRSYWVYKMLHQNIRVPRIATDISPQIKLSK